LLVTVVTVSLLNTYLKGLDPCGLAKFR
jgi:hypothetical protein